ncbi:MAG: hypothetical protein ACRD30_00050 [Bryobacteraceae bacterium]
MQRRAFLAGLAGFAAVRGQATVSIRRDAHYFSLHRFQIKRGGCVPMLKSPDCLVLQAVVAVHLPQIAVITETGALGSLQAARHWPQTARFFELRVYDSPSADLNEQFAEAGIFPLLRSTVNQPNDMVLIPWDSLRQRDRAWARFKAPTDAARVIEISIFRPI